MKKVTKSIFKKIILSLLLVGIFLTPQKVLAEESTNVNIYFFWSKTCPHCKKEGLFLTGLQEKYDYLNVYGFELSFCTPLDIL